MPSPEKFDQTLETLAEYVEDVGDDIAERNVPNVLDATIGGTDYSLTGHRCTRGDSRYVVAGHPELRLVTVVYFLSIINNLAADLDNEVAESIVDEEYEDEDELRREAAEILLDRVPREEMDAFRSYCYLFISASTHETSFFSNEDGSLLLFGVGDDIFPYEESFGISDFYDAVRTTVSTGERGNRLVSRSVFIEVDEESPEETEVTLNFNW